MNRFLTVFLPTENVHLYKDVGMIPYCLAKFCGYHSELLYVGKRKLTRDNYYEQYVKLVHIEATSEILQCLRLFSFVYQNAKKYDIVNFYHLSIKNFIMPILFKLFNSKCKIYLKLDLDQMNFDNLITQEGGRKRRTINCIKSFFIKKFVDIISVETKQYYEELKTMKMFSDKLIYVPNGILIEKKIMPIEKKNIILTVGRIGTRQKNNELLVDAIAKIPFEKIKNWQVYFVGSIEESFKNYVAHVITEKAYLARIFVLTGNISDKEKLYSMYAQAKIFCLTSRWEGFCLVIPEAMYFGNYVITTDFAAAYDLTNNQNVGKIIHNEDLTMLSEILLETIDEKFDVVNKGKIAKKYIETCFLWNTIVQKLDEELKFTYGENE